MGVRHRETRRKGWVGGKIRSCSRAHASWLKLEASWIEPNDDSAALHYMNARCRAAVWLLYDKPPLYINHPCINPGLPRYIFMHVGLDQPYEWAIYKYTLIHIHIQIHIHIAKIYIHCREIYI